MKNLILLFLSMTLFFACGQSGEQDSKKETPAISEVKETPEVTPNGTVAGEKGNSATMRGQYVSVSVNAAETDYGFLLDNGEQISVRVSNEEGVVNPVVPSNMLDDGSDFGGFKSGNDELIGKYFTIEKNAEGQYVKVVYSEEQAEEE